MIIGNEPYVLEFNVRFGDPETQAILPRLKTDLLDIIEASIDGRIKNLRPRWNPRPCVSVVCASGGYPGPYKKGLPIYGLDKVEKLKDITVFHAGTGKTKDGQYETSGGRVLGVTALGRDTKDAIDKAYQACSLVSFEEMHYRKDIGYRALKIVN
jgi:phosphoribosylamine--glycine ligase